MYLRLTLAYEGFLADTGAASHQYGSESQPRLTVFLTHGLSRGRACTTASLAATGKSPAKTVVVCTLAFDPGWARTWLSQQQQAWALDAADSSGGGSDQIILPATAAVGINAYALTYAEGTGQTCESRVGSAYLPLAAIFEGWRGQVALRDTTGDDGVLVKGNIQLLRCDVLGDGSSGAETFRFFRPPDKHHRHRRQQRMHACIDANMALFFGHQAPLPRATFPFLRHIHCPTYETEAGTLPNFAFSLRLPTTPVPLAVFAHCLQIVRWRQALPAAEAPRLARAVHQALGPRAPDGAGVLALDQAAVLLVRMLCVFANAVVYENDFVAEDGATVLPPTTASRIRSRLKSASAPSSEDMRPISESFKNALRVGGADCEDVAQLCYWEACQFRDTPPALVAAADEDGLLGALHALLQLYIPLMTLGAVTTAKLEISSSQRVANDALMAHTFCVLLPFAVLRNGLVDVPETSLLRQSATWKTGVELAQAWHATLKTLVCEGTARMDPRAILPFPQWSAGEPLAWARAKARAQDRARDAAGERAAGVIGWEMLPSLFATEGTQAYDTDRRDVSGFYKAPVSAYAGHAFRDVRIGDLVFALPGPPPTYGCSFNTLVLPALRQGLRIVPGRQLTVRDAAIVNDVLMQLEPDPVIRLTGEERVPRALAEAFAGFAPAADEAEESPGPCLVFSVRDQDLDAATIAGLVRAARAAAGASVAVRSWRLCDPLIPGDAQLRLVLHEVRVTLRLE